MKETEMANRVMMTAQLASTETIARLLTYILEW